MMYRENIGCRKCRKLLCVHVHLGVIYFFLFTTKKRKLTRTICYNKTTQKLKVHISAKQRCIRMWLARAGGALVQSHFSILKHL